MELRLTKLAILSLLLTLMIACSNSGFKPMSGDDDQARDGDQSDIDSDVTSEDGDGDTELEVSPDGDADVDFVIDEIDLVQYVDPMIGTDGSGNTIPGAAMPHGMVKLSPDTNAEAGSIDAYEYSHDKIDGFSHTHLEGPGGGSNGYSQILFMPRVGAVEIDRENYASAFSHDTEEASPGYYAVTLSDSGIRTELTAARRAGFHRYTFPASTESHVLIDLGYSRGDPIDGKYDVISDTVVEGYGTYSVHPLLNFVLGHGDGSTSVSTVYFHAEFNKPFSAHGTWSKAGEAPVVNPGGSSESGANIGGYVQFETTENEVVDVRVGISFIDVEHARINLETDIGDASFDEVRENTRQAWNSLLNRIQVEGGSDDDKTIFYTALYHSFLQPTDSTEAGGEFYTAAAGTDSVTTADGWEYYTDDWCMWDTYRTSHPLATLIEPETQSDVVRSLLHWYQEGGWLPKCTWHATGYSRVMIGNHAVPIIVDAYTKGIRSFDRELAYEAVYKAAMEDNDNPTQDSMCGYLNLGTVPAYIENGYVPAECDGTQSASMTLEYAYDDYCTAQFAQALGKENDYEMFMERSQNFRNHWNPEYGFMQGRHENGDWVEPFDPTADDEFNQFCEATSWIYSFFVPHAVPDLIELMGGKAEFISRLDTYFDSDFHDPSNQPGFHVPYLYHFADRPDLSQNRVAQIMGDNFHSSPNGLPGNDDAGAMSAWYVLGALGLYPVAPGNPVWQVKEPAFDRITIHLHPAFFDGGTFVIEKVSGGELSAQLNGEALPGMAITHQQIAEGGVMQIHDGVSGN